MKANEANVFLLLIICGCCSANRTPVNHNALNWAENELSKKEGPNEEESSAVLKSKVHEIEGQLKYVKDEMTKREANMEFRLFKRFSDLKSDVEKKLEKMTNVLEKMEEKFEKFLEKEKTGDVNDANHASTYAEEIGEKLFKRCNAISHHLDIDIRETEKALHATERTCQKMSSVAEEIKKVTGTTSIESLIVSMTKNLAHDMSREMDAKMEAWSGVCKSTTSTRMDARCCSHLRKSGVTCDGTYLVYPQFNHPVLVYCDMQAYGGGWTVLMRRGDFEEENKRLSFDRSWTDYKNGFGNASKEFWIGNENMHQLTKKNDTILQVVLESYEGEKMMLEYDTFYVGPELDNYRLHVGDFRGQLNNFGKDILELDKRPFSTYDRDNNRDATPINCAARYKGGWWYYGFFNYAILTPSYDKKTDRANGDSIGLKWRSWKGDRVLKAAEMRIRHKHMS